MFTYLISQLVGLALYPLCESKAVIPVNRLPTQKRGYVAKITSKRSFSCTDHFLQPVIMFLLHGLVSSGLLTIIFTPMTSSPYQRTKRNLSNSISIHDKLLNIEGQRPNYKKMQWHMRNPTRLSCYCHRDVLALKRISRSKRTWAEERGISTPMPFGVC